MILKEGSYYKLKHTKYTWLFRFGGLSVDKLGITTTGYNINIDGDIYTFAYDNHTGFSNTLNDRCVEISFKDIKNYLPLGHPDIIEYRNKRIKMLLQI